jgi:sugar lactone lactonase YvrE
MIERALAAGAALAECPVWDPLTGTLLWVDIEQGSVHRFDPERAVDTIILQLDRPVSAIAIREAGGLVLAVSNGIWLADSDGATHPVANLYGTRSGVRMNDGKCDPKGRFIAGSMSTKASRPGHASLYALQPSGHVSTLLSGLSLCNGLGWSPNGRRFYLADSNERTVTAYPYNPDQGELGPGRRLITIAQHEGAPDGLAVDTDGCLWIAICGGSAIRRYSDRGELIDTIHLPTPLVTSCAFAGPNLQHLFITTAATGLPTNQAQSSGAGDVYVLDARVHGLQVSTYAG